MNAACARLTWPVRMIRCSDAAPIAVMHSSTPTWCRNLSSVSHGQPSSTITPTIHHKPCRAPISGLRCAEDAPRPHDQEQDHDTERQERRGRGAVERADEALGEAEED